MTGVVLELVDDQVDVEPPVVVDLVKLYGLEDMPVVMSPRTLSEYSEISVTTLQRWRMTWPDGDCTGPAFFEPAGAHMVRYSRADFAAWLHASRVSDPT